ncbi:GMC family oxidoreductase [Leptospira gomenensis]|uniref:GMC family oxidoreductase n=1 Tax=Leptospira gomenensis TaxID=2484974 RepID=A0A5F1YT36_9LEPT|nr:GMC family oxidoreductase [Leptospira gomenensis]TGK38610.1 GMC family oxidoreductase [Leptospira gomenensis]TGK42847.1 GMC family oxidoreductase [Leptospira gomenensis]TGK49608.1 GMC family oxidoreductase [Leptospira gomenensis]TGK60722.1 GMC family oxidoreductase [Leptospira gomenensis]
MSGKIYEWKHIDADRTVTADVCVVGTGCGGSTIALQLALAGKKVVLIEQGGYYHTGTFDNHELNMAAKVSGERNLATTQDGTINIVYGNNVGGASVHYWADSYRTPNDKLLLWEKKYGIQGHTETDLAPFWPILEKRLNVHPAEDQFFNRMNSLVQTASHALGWEGRRVPQARKNCQKSGHCMQGCAFGAKQSQLVTQIPMAVAAGADIYADCKAVELVEKDDRIESLRARIIDRRTLKENGIELSVKAEVFVVAAGGFGSSTLLLKNGWKKKLPALGEFVSINPTVFVHSLFDEEIIQWRNIPAAYGVEEFRLARYDENGNYREGGYMLMPNQLQPGALGATLPGFGEQHERYMKNLPRLGGTIAWLDDVETELGNITWSKNRRRVNYSFGPITKKMMKDSYKKQTLLNLKAGAKEVLIPNASGLTIRSPSELNRIDELTLEPVTAMMAAPHPGGGCRMGSDPKTSVVDSSHRVHGTKNLYVSDSSVFPTSSSVDPSFTIMAFSMVAAEKILERSGKHG